MIDWLLSPIDSARLHDVSGVEAWHGRLMFIGWVVLIPLAVLIARYFKVTARQRFPERLDNPFWWRSHLVLQSVGIASTVLAIGLMYFDLRDGIRLESLHRHLGWAAVALAALQILSGIFRGTKGGPTSPAKDGSLRGDHFDMSVRRRIFEYFHKSVGYLTVIVANLAVLTGLWRANAPRWMWFCFALCWIVLIAAAVYFQRRNMAVDTYQAIWGSDPALRGNRIRPIGWGVSRWSEKSNGFE